jgi:hypothetical protein
LVPTRTAEDLNAGWWQHLSTLGATPRRSVTPPRCAWGRARKLSAPGLLFIAPMMAPFVQAGCVSVHVKGGSQT